MSGGTNVTAHSCEFDFIFALTLSTCLERSVSVHMLLDLPTPPLILRKTIAYVVRTPMPCKLVSSPNLAHCLHGCRASMKRKKKGTSCFCLSYS